jgi:hypothetical protein
LARVLVGSLAIVGALLAARSALAVPLRVVQGPCEGDARKRYGETPDLYDPAWGKVASDRLVRLRFNYAVEPGADKAAAIDETDKVEVCYLTANGHARCPASTFIPTWLDEQWLVFNEVSLPHPGYGQEPSVSDVFEVSNTAPRDKVATDWFDLDIDWQNPAWRGTVLFVRVNGTDELPELSEVAQILADGFCPVPTPMDWGGAYYTPSPHFRIHGVPAEVEPYATALAGLGLSLCADGDRSTVGTHYACAPWSHAKFLSDQLEKMDYWQSHWFLGDGPPVESWHHGSGGDCGPGTACPLRVFYMDNYFPGAGSLAGRMWIRTDPSMSPCPACSPPPSYPQLWPLVGYELAVVGHEYFHDLQYAYTRSEAPGVSIPQGHGIGNPVLLEPTAQRAGADHCLAQYDGLPSDLVCASPYRIRYMPGEREWAATNWLTLSTASPFGPNPATLEYDRANFALQYMAEQFAVRYRSTDQTHNPAHPGNMNFEGHSAMEANFSLNIGDKARRTDEGMDLFRYLFDQQISADTHISSGSTPTVIDSIDLALRNVLGRSLDNVMLDFATMAVLKDYRNAADPKVDARWHLEWAGNLNAGASQDYFPYNPRDPSTLEQHKLAHTGQFAGMLVVPPDLHAVGADYLPRAFRALDSYEPRQGLCPPSWTTCGGVPRYFSRNDAPITGSVWIGPYGMGVISLHPKKEATPWNVRVHLRFDHGHPLVRTFAVTRTGLPYLFPCHAHPVSDQPAPVGVCDTYDTSVSDGHGGYTMATFVDVPIAVSPATDPWEGLLKEVLVIVSASHDEGASLDYTVDKLVAQPYHMNPSRARPVALQSTGSEAGRSFDAQFAVTDAEGGPVQVTPEMVTLRFPGCAEQPTDPTRPPCELRGGEPGVVLSTIGAGQYRARVSLPQSFIPLGAEGTLGFEAVVGDELSNIEPDAIRVRAHAPRTALGLVLDRSAAVAGSKLEATKIAAELVLRSLGEEDAVGLVTFDRDAQTLVPLASRCAASTDPVGVALAELGALQGSPQRCASPGDGLFEAQSMLADALDLVPAAGGLATCLPDRQAVLVVSAGPSLADYPIEAYSANVLSESPATDGTGAPTECGPDTDENDNRPWSERELRAPERQRLGLALPAVAAVAIGQDAPLGALRALTLGSANRGLLATVDDSAAAPLDAAQMTIELADAVRQATDALMGYERVTSYQALGASPSDLRGLAVEPGSDELLVSVASAGPRVDGLLLVSPSGVTLAPSSAGLHASVFRLAAPEPGTWSWAWATDNTGASGGGSEPSVFVELAVKSAVALRASADVLGARPPNDVAGVAEDGAVTAEPVLIRAELAAGTEPVPDATVVAEVAKPDGTSIEVELRDDGRSHDGDAGDGIFAAVFRDTFEQGAYEVRLRATGNYAGARFEREKRLTLLLSQAPDQDEDGLPDWWEARYGSSLTSLEPHADDDHDGLDNLAELHAHTSPVEADTDGGGEADGSEVAAGLDPLDEADDRIGPFEPLLAPGNGAVLGAADLLLSIEQQAVLEIERGPAEGGPFELALAGGRPEGGGWLDEADNGVARCYRMRVTVDSATSRWSTPQCVLPALDPFPPEVELSLASDEPFVHELRASIHIAATDEPASRACTGGRPVVGGGPRDPRLVDPSIVPSGVGDMLVSTRSDFRGASWQPYEPELAVDLPESDPKVIYVRVRDLAGNESPTASLIVPWLDAWPREAVVGQEMVRVGPEASVEGEISVLEQNAGLAPGQLELWLGRRASVTSTVRADSVWIGLDASVAGALVYNELVNHGTVTGALETPLVIPVHAQLPDPGAAAPGSADVTVERSATRTLAAGSYRVVRCKAGRPSSPTVLRLAGGSYDFARLLLGNQSRLECATACSVRIAGDLWAGRSSFIGPAASSATLKASDVAVSVLGPTGGAPCGDPPADAADAQDCSPPGDDDSCAMGELARVASLGPQSVLDARLYAPRGLLSVGRGAQVHGTLAAQRVRIGREAHVSKE